MTTVENDEAVALRVISSPVARAYMQPIVDQIARRMSADILAHYDQFLLDERLPPDVSIAVTVGEETLLISGIGDVDEQWNASRSCNKKAQ